MERIRVLGTIEVADPAQPGALRQPPSLRARKLLAALCVRAGEVCSADWLVSAVWGDDPPEHGGGALQTLVSRLRTTLAGVDGVALVTRPPGYLLQLDLGALDAHAFAELAARGAETLPSDPQGAVSLLDAALALWRGAAYAEFADDEVVRAEATRLTELHATVVDDRIDAALALGRHHEVAARLEPLVAAEPLRERRQAQLMLARYRAGRQAEALETYRAFHALLDEELGIEPSEQLQQLHTAMLRSDPALQWSLQVVAAPTQPAAEGNLRGDPVRLIGRGRETRDVVQLLAEAPVVTLCGPGGVGKTVLANHVARAVADRHREGVWVVELAAVSDPDTVPHVVASTLDVPARQGTSTTDRVVESLSGRRALLVLDNCEHVPDAVAALVAALRRGAPTVTLLLTSQLALAVEDEQVYPVGPLDVAHDHQDGAVRLFVERARRHHRGFTLDRGNATAVAEVCRRLDGLPLAIELAAARMRSMSPEELAARLSGRFRLLHGGTRTARERHRTLRALVDWSYELLSEQERAVFEVLSVFAGAFTLEQAERLVTETLADVPDATAAGDLVLFLADRSMVVAVPGVPTSYHLLETLRAYGREKLAGRPYAEEARAAHARLFADLVAPTADALWTDQHLASVALVGSCFDELRAAQGWAREHDVPLAARIVRGCGILVEHRMNAEVAHWADRLRPLLEHPASTATADEVAAVLLVAAGGARFSGALEEADELVSRAEELAEDVSVRCRAGYLRAEVAGFQGDLGRSEAALETVAVEAQRHGLESVLRFADVNQALATAYRGDGPVAERLAARAMHAAEDAGEAVIAAWAAYVRGESLLEDDPAAAEPLLAAALDRATGVGDRYLVGVTLVSLASARARAGDPWDACSLFRRAVEHWHRSGNWTHQWTTLRNVVVLLARLGRHHEAAVVDGALETRETTARAAGAEAVRMRETRDGLVAILGPEEYDEAADAGARLSDDALVARVLDVLAGLPDGAGVTDPVGAAPLSGAAGRTGRS